MKKSLSIISLIILSNSSFAQESKVISLDIEKFCTKDKLVIGGDEFIVKDEGFCEKLKKIKEENQQVDVDFIKDIDKTFLDIEKVGVIDFSCSTLNSEEVSAKKKSDDKWKFRFYASHSFTTYYDTDIKFRSTRYNVDVKDYTWTERGSRDFFKFEKLFLTKGNNPFQIIDEPSNKFVASLEKNGHKFFLSAFHPKFYQEDQTKYMKGTIDGVEVDGVYDINKPFDGYNQEPGEMELVRNQNTGGEMIFEVGYGHRFKLLEGKAGNLVYTPSVGVGVTTGSNFTVIIQEGKWWDFNDYKENYRVQGYGGTVSNKIEYTIPSGRFGIFYENNLGFYKQKHGFLDGTQEYDLKFMGNNIGLVFLLNKSKKKIKAKD